MDCIHCGNCTRHCDFLTKYQLDLEGFSQHPELAYHCFLCGECTACCPKGIDGREIALKMRCKKVEEQNGVFSKVPEIKRQKMLVLEKKNYLFCNYRAQHLWLCVVSGVQFSILLSENDPKAH